MRIVPVTGDLPALVTPPPLPVRSSTGAPPPPAAAPVEPAAATGNDADAATDHRHPRGTSTFFDPPLIAQRAVLGLPTGHLVADLARSTGVTFTAVPVAVGREMPPPAG